MKTFLRGILYRVLWEFNKGFRLYYLRSLQWEKDLEDIFSLLLPRSYVGLPKPRIDLSYRILPYMVKEMYIMQEKSSNPLRMKTGWLKCLKI